MKKLAVLLCLFFSSSVFAYSYSCFPIMSGKNTFVLNPYVYGSFESKNVSTDLIAVLSPFDKLDIWADVGSLTFDSKAIGYNTWWVMPRFAITANHIVALMSNDVFTSLQYHGVFFENKRFFVQNNSGIDFVYEVPRDLNVWTILSPGLKISFGDVYCDVGISSLAGETFVKLVPGLGLSIKDNLFSIGVKRCHKKHTSFCRYVVVSHV